MIEALLLRHDPANGFAYRRRITPLERHANPDHTARLLAHLQEDNDRHLVHSTSWRATDNGHIVLTYLIHPDPDPGQPALPWRTRTTSPTATAPPTPHRPPSNWNT